MGSVTVGAWKLEPWPWCRAGRGRERERERDSMEHDEVDDMHTYSSRDLEHNGTRLLFS